MKKDSVFKYGDFMVLVIGCLLTPCKGLRTYPTMTLGDNIIIVVNAE